MTEPTDAEQYLNAADQCAATATSELAASILVDGGNGTLRHLLNDAADAIRAGWNTPQPTQAQAGAVDEITIITAPSGYQWIAEPGDVERFSLPGQGHKIVTYVAIHGIKGGQHG